MLYWFEPINIGQLGFSNSNRYNSYTAAALVIKLLREKMQYTYNDVIKSNAPTGNSYCVWYSAAVMIAFFA